ncbi:MAG: MotA/TolQ/Exb proton channel [Nitrospiraceae bacterium]|nr:MotA/TolQ/Exb proton channel [Nitrospiraceae bacterium]
MKTKAIWSLFVAIVVLLTYSGTLYAKDMRARQIEVEKKRAVLLEKASSEKEAALKKAMESRQRILSNRKALETAISELKKKNRQLKKERHKYGTRLGSLSARLKGLRTTFEKKEGEVSELVGLIRIDAKDLDALLRQSQQSAFVPERERVLQPILNQTAFPGMHDIRSMVNLLFEEINLSGQVRDVKGPFVDRSGKETLGNILVLGNFSAAYQIPGETGFLIYSTKSQRLFALSKLPSWHIKREIKAYMSGKSMDVPIDISKGAALRQLTHRLSLMEEIQRGGPIVWPIIGIAVLATLIIIERGIYLFRNGNNIGAFASSIYEYASRGEWNRCIELCEHKKERPLPRVLLAGIRGRDMEREDMENILQEAILNEIPGLERFLSTLGMLGAIAPLLGLLGTVTGMINTFHVITYYGTGDPRMMSAGISEALVTTMLGLTAAIPIMIFHTLISKRVENIIAQMEEKAVTLVNIVFKTRKER